MDCKISIKVKAHFLNLIDKFLKAIQIIINMKLKIMFKINQFKKMYQSKDLRLQIIKENQTKN